MAYEQTISIQDIISQKELGEPTEEFLERVANLGVSTQLTDSLAGKTVLRMRGARIPRGVEPSQILSHQARRLGEDGVDRKVRELSRLVAKGEMGIQLAMRELCQNPEATTIHQERLQKQIPGGQMLAIKWAILSSEERAKELYFHDRQGLVERTNEPERSSRAKERQPEQHKGESFFDKEHPTPDRGQ